MKKNLVSNYCLIIFLLIIGLCVSSIGITFCRYQVVMDDNEMKFNVRGAGDYYIIDNNEQWQLDKLTQACFLNFSVTNTINNTKPKTNSSFYVRVSLDTPVNMNMILTDLSGREIVCEGMKTKNGNQYDYYFVDEYDKEVRIDLEGNKKSTENIRLEVYGSSYAYLSEISIVDASYRIEKEIEYAGNQGYSIMAESNYLSANEDFVYIVDNGTYDISLTSNMNAKSIVKYKTSSDNIMATLNNKSSVNVDLEADVEETVSLKINSNSSEDETVTVIWQLLDKNGTIIGEMKSKFLVRGRLSTVDNLTVQMETEDQEFHKYKPLEFSIKSSVDSLVDIREELLPVNTRYSVNNGKTWYILTKEDSLRLNLKANTSQKVIIDFRYTDMLWTDRVFNIYAYYNDEEISKLKMNMKSVDDVTVLQLTDIHTGIINDSDVSFIVNDTNIDISLEYFDNEKYQSIDIDTYFTLSNNDNKYTLTLKNVSVPKGIYRIKITQLYDDINIDEEYLSFYVIDKSE